MVIVIRGRSGCFKTTIANASKAVVTSQLTTPGYLLELAAREEILVIDDYWFPDAAFARAVRKAAKITNLIICTEGPLPSVPIDVLMEEIGTTLTFDVCFRRTINAT